MASGKTTAIQLATNEDEGSHGGLEDPRLAGSIEMPQYLHAVLWHPMLLVTFSLHGVDRANIGSEVNSLVVYCEYCFTVVCLLHRNRLLHRLKHQQMVGGLQAKICFIDLSL
jgi:hypothetical protein